jgi:hypothetical protein
MVLFVVMINLCFPQNPVAGYKYTDGLQCQF